MGLGLGFGLALAPGFGLRVGAGVRAGVTAQPAKVSSFDVRAASSAAMKKVLSPISLTKMRDSACGGKIIRNRR